MGKSYNENDRNTCNSKKKWKRPAITLNEIRNALKRMKKANAPGDDSWQNAKRNRWPSTK